MNKLHKYSHIISILLTVASLIYIAKILLESDLDTSLFKNPVFSLFYIIMFGIFTSFFILTNAYVWKLILEFINGTTLTSKDIYRVYLQSNIAKYLPGNIMHYAGRNYLGNRLGWKNSEIALSSTLEYILNIGTLGLIILFFIMIGFINIPPQISLKINFSKIIGYSFAGVTGAFVLICIYRYIVARERIQQTTANLWQRVRRLLTFRFLKLLIIVSLISLCLFVLNCLYYYYLCDLVLDFKIKPEDFFNVNAALAIANLASVLTPGVPAGMGVRESASFLLISSYGYPKGVLIMSILVLRVTCVLGDLISFMMVPFFRK